MDIDYNVVENTRTGTKHLVIQPKGSKFADLSTVCGIVLKNSNIFYNTKEIKKFWRSNMRCNNCDRAAKR